MRWLHTRWIVAAAALMASGCLLPQPDTPWVPPGVQTPVSEGARPADATIAQPAAPQATAEPVPGPSARVWVQVSGQVVGIEATAIAAVAEVGWRVDMPLGAGGEFALSVPWGLFNRYWLELTTANGVLRLEPPISLSGPDARRITIRSEGGRLTFEEDAKVVPAVSPTPLAPASPSPTPSPGAGNTATAVVQ